MRDMAGWFTHGFPVACRLARRCLSLKIIPTDVLKDLNQRNHSPTDTMGMIKYASLEDNSGPGEGVFV